MPTEEEAGALIAACDSYWTALNGVQGCLLESKETGAFLFLPCGGHTYGQGSTPTRTHLMELWTSSLTVSNNKRAQAILGSVDYYGIFKIQISFGDRYDGLPIRPVIE